MTEQGETHKQHTPLPQHLWTGTFPPTPNFNNSSPAPPTGSFSHRSSKHNICMQYGHVSVEIPLPSRTCFMCSSQALCSRRMVCSLSRLSSRSSMVKPEASSCCSPATLTPLLLLLASPDPSASPGSKSATCEKNRIVCAFQRSQREAPKAAARSYVCSLCKLVVQHLARLLAEMPSCICACVTA